MPVKISIEEEVVTAYINGEIDHHNAKMIREKIDSAIERVKPEMVILDFKDVLFMDSSGIGLVMGRYRLAQMYGGNVRVVNTSSQIKKVMRLAGLDKLADIQ